MVKRGEIFSGEGYKFNKTKEGQTMIEFHVDDHPMFTGMGSLHPFGGNLSVRMLLTEKALIIFGQDKCIYKQYLYKNMFWIGPNGETPLMHKTNGQALMILGFVCTEIVFGWKLSPSQLKIGNKYCGNKNYCDQKAAITKHGKIEKDPLKGSPFVRELEYGSMKE